MDMLATIALRRGLRRERELSRTCFDIDDCKLVNDRYSLAAGDAVRRLAVDTARKTTRARSASMRCFGRPTSGAISDPLTE